MIDHNIAGLLYLLIVVAAIVLLVVWVMLPFAVMRLSARTRELIYHAENTNKLLADILRATQKAAERDRP